MTTAIAPPLLTALADALTVPDGGFTVDLRTGEHVTDGYAVSVHPECERVLTDSVSTDDLRQYLADHAATLELPSRVLGGWRDPVTGSAFLDVSIVLGEQRQALSVAREHDQLAIFDIARGESIDLAVRS